MPAAAASAPARGPDTAWAAAAWRRALEKTAAIGTDPTRTLPAVIDEMAGRLGDAPALISDEETLTYRGLADRAGRYARWALRRGVSRGDVVCLLMGNCADYMAIWLGVARVGGVVALINPNLTGDALAHSIGIVTPRHVVVAAELAPALLAVRDRLPAGIAYWAHGAGDVGLPRIDHQTADDRPAAAIDAPPRPVLDDRALYIYTSGTTGLPKAAAVSHRRLLQWTHWFAGMMDAGPADRLYNCLPMYHSIGGVVATGSLLVAGGSVLIRRHFSASRFWDDACDGGCTLFQYVGELCRYLANAPEHPRERSHRLRLACGNGLRGDVWERFQDRFDIPRILEFYAATEASFSLYNCEGRPGAIGRIPPFLAHRFPVALIRVDPDTGEPLRDADGRCARCAPDEPGEAIGRLGDGGGRFEGYTDREASGRKILRDVFATGDAWYRTGDLMRRDARGFFYFVDRLGDTFRWKGENVATLEVEAAVAGCPGVVEAVVYGVGVPGTEGRAGMAAVAAGAAFDVADLQRHLAARLPEYARPLFLRLRSDIERTGTFKPVKRRLADAGYDPAACGDALYVFDRQAAEFVRLDAALYARIIRGELRF